LSCHLFLHTVKQYLSFTGNLQPPFELPKQIFSGQECLRCCWPKPRLQQPLTMYWKLFLESPRMGHFTRPWWHWY